MTGKYIFFLLLFPALAATAQITSCKDPVFEGEGTYYAGIAGTSSGHCTLPVAAGDVFHAAMNHTQYAGSEPCGSCVKVQGPKGSVTVKIVDECPECAFGDIDLAEGAFPYIAEPIQGRVKISWHYVPCPRANGISLLFDPGSSAYYHKIQVRDAYYGIQKLEFKKKDGSYVSIPRTPDNYFQYMTGIDEDKSKTGPYTFRFTAFTGDVVEAEGVPFSKGNLVPTHVQFAPLSCHITGVDESDAVDTWMASNPFKEELSVNGNKSLTKMVLCELNGKVLLESTHTSIPTADIPSGVYLLQIWEKEKVVVKRVLKY